MTRAYFTTDYSECVCPLVHSCCCCCCFFKLRATATRPIVEITSQHADILEFELDTVTEWIVGLFPVGMVDVLKTKMCKNRNKVVFGNPNINKN